MGERHDNIEIQKNDNGAIPERARYNSSIIDANITLPGDDPKDLPEVYVIFITQNDVFGKGKPLYTVSRKIEELDNADFGDRSHIVYVNGNNRDAETALGKLMQDFFCEDPDNMNYKLLADRVRYFKENKEGQIKMCKMLEYLILNNKHELIEEGRTEGANNANTKTAFSMIADGRFAFEDIAKFTSLSVEKIRELAAISQTANA